MPIDLTVVAPVYNEESGIEEFCRQLRSVLDQMPITYEIILVDDGSQDQSWTKIKAVESLGGHLRGIRFARNFGHQLAITAGLQYSLGKAVVVMDSDLQDPVNVIPELFKKWQSGHEIVFAVRDSRQGETWFKKVTAYMFYRILRAWTKIDIQKDAGDFYLLDRKVVDIIKQIQERHRFLRGLLAWVGYSRACVPYTRLARYQGRSKFSLWKMICFSLDAATAFSFVPLRAISLLGFIICGMSFIGILITFYIKLFTSWTVTGWSSLMVTVLFMGGIQMVAIGIIGEYLARIGDDVKQRPLFVICDMFGRELK